MANEHIGHRSRMKERFLHTHFDGFEDHQILEMILFYVYPRSDTNPLAHRLLNKFGSIAAILDSPVDVLIKAGLTKNAATFLVMLPDISRIYLDDRNNNESKIIDFSNIVSTCKGGFSSIIFSVNFIKTNNHYTISFNFNDTQFSSGVL